MALVKNSAVALLLLVLVLVESTEGTVYKVGDSAGWTTIGNVDYKQWAATKTFKLGDVIVFKYASQFHNVMRVTHAMYKACNVSAPLATYTSGNDSITIKTRGHHYFFCGVPGHCQAGQKVDINVPRLTQELSPAPSISPSPSTSTDSPVATSSPVPIAKVPGTTPNTAALCHKSFASIVLASIFMFFFV